MTLKKTILLIFACFRISSMENKEEELLFYAHKNNIKEVKRLINQNVDINCQNKYGITPLMEATDRSNIKMMELLIKNGANVNIKDYNGNTAIIYAIFTNESNTLKKLIYHKADNNCINDISITPIRLAALMENKKILGILVAAGSDIKPIEKYKDYLSFALNILIIFFYARENYAVYFKNCMKQNLFLDLHDKSGNTLLHWAIINKNKEIIKLLLSRDPKLISIPDYKNQTPVDVAFNHFASSNMSKDSIFVFFLNLAYL